MFRILDVGCGIQQSLVCCVSNVSSTIFVEPASAVLTLIASVFHVLLGMFGGALSRFFAKRTKSAWLQKWGLAAVLMALAVRLAVMSRPA